jgi:plasmid replication initiation protein
MSQTLESIIQELQNRIGQITTQYETQLAVLKVQANEALKQKDEEINQLKSVSVDAEPTKKEK